jgi:hypothetical protein
MVMTKKLYLDGCSYTEGRGLETEYTLAALFSNEGNYDVINNSRSGKSNLAIALDTYKHSKNADVVVLGFTFASRFYIKYQQHNLDFAAPREKILIRDDDLNADQLEHSYAEFHKCYYALGEDSYFNSVSDLLIDSLCSHILQQGKQLICFSWETRNISNKILYPHIAPSLRLPDGHLNIKGTRYLYNVLQKEIGGQE